MLAFRAQRSAGTFSAGQVRPVEDFPRYLHDALERHGGMELVEVDPAGVVHAARFVTTRCLVHDGQQFTPKQEIHGVQQWPTFWALRSIGAIVLAPRGEGEFSPPTLPPPAAVKSPNRVRR